MTTVAHPLRVLVDPGDGRTPTYQLDVDTAAAVVGCTRAAGHGPFGPAVAVLVAEPAQPSGSTRRAAFALVPAAAGIEPDSLPGWLPTALGTIGDQVLVEVTPDPAWQPAT